MKFTWAQQQLNLGKPVTRGAWITRLLPHPRYGADCPLWDLPEYLHDEYPDRTYIPPPTDRAADDWVLA